MNISFRKPVAAAVSAVYFLANAVFLHAAETNIWDERRKASAHLSGPVASLPVSADPLTVLKGLPHIQAQTLSPSVMENLAADAGESVVRRHLDVLRAIPPAHGTIRRVSPPSGPSTGRTVVFLQDVHENDEAQANLGGIVSSLAERPEAKVAFFAMEAAFAPIPVEKYRNFHNQNAVRASADYLLKEREISGPIHAAYTHPGRMPPFLGVDDPARYEANIEAYRRSAPSQMAQRRALAVKLHGLEKEKKKAFNEELSSFDRLVTAYHRERVSFGDYAQAVAGTSPAAGPLSHFLEALAAEKAMDFKAVEKERARLIEDLVRKLDKAKLDELLRFSLAYRVGDLGHTDYYRSLKEFCRKNGVDLAAYPAMDAYVRYVLLSGRINADKLFTALTAAEKAAYARLARTPEEKRLVESSRRMVLEAKLLDFSLTPDEWAEYSAFAGAHPTFEAFYQEADARNHAMTDNILKAMDERRAAAAALVAGGFHTSGMSRLLTEKGVTVIEVAPKLTKVDGSASAYLGVFTQEKTPLEKLFKGNRLFVGKTPDKADGTGVGPAMVAMNDVLDTGDKEKGAEGFQELMEGREGTLEVNSVVEKESAQAVISSNAGKAKARLKRNRNGDTAGFTVVELVTVVGTVVGLAVGALALQTHFANVLAVIMHLHTVGASWVAGNASWLVVGSLVTAFIFRRQIGKRGRTLIAAIGIFLSVSCGGRSNLDLPIVSTDEQAQAGAASAAGGAATTAGTNVGGAAGKAVVGAAGVESGGALGEGGDTGSTTDPDLGNPLFQDPNGVVEIYPDDGVPAGPLHEGSVEDVNGGPAGVNPDTAVEGRNAWYHVNAIGKPVGVTAIFAEPIEPKGFLYVRVEWRGNPFAPDDENVHLRVTLTDESGKEYSVLAEVPRSTWEHGRIVKLKINLDKAKAQGLGRIAGISIAIPDEYVSGYGYLNVDGLIDSQQLESTGAQEMSLFGSGMIVVNIALYSLAYLVLRGLVALGLVDPRVLETLRAGVRARQDRGWRHSGRRGLFAGLLILVGTLALATGCAEFVPDRLHPIHKDVPGMTAKEGLDDSYAYSRARFAAPTNPGTVDIVQDGQTASGLPILSVKVHDALADGVVLSGVDPGVNADGTANPGTHFAVQNDSPWALNIAQELEADPADDPSGIGSDYAARTFKPGQWISYHVEAGALRQVTIKPTLVKIGDVATTEFVDSASIKVVGVSPDVQIGHQEMSLFTPLGLLVQSAFFAAVYLFLRLLVAVGLMKRSTLDSFVRVRVSPPADRAARLYSQPKRLSVLSLMVLGLALAFATACKSSGPGAAYGITDSAFLDDPTLYKIPSSTEEDEMTQALHALWDSKIGPGLNEMTEEQLNRTMYAPYILSTLSLRPEQRVRVITPWDLGPLTVVLFRYDSDEVYKGHLGEGISALSHFLYHFRKGNIPAMIALVEPEIRRVDPSGRSLQIFRESIALLLAAAPRAIQAEKEGYDAVSEFGRQALEDSKAKKKAHQEERVRQIPPAVRQVTPEQVDQVAGVVENLPGSGEFQVMEFMLSYLTWEEDPLMRDEKAEELAGYRRQRIQKFMESYDPAKALEMLKLKKEYGRVEQIDAVWPTVQAELDKIAPTLDPYSVTHRAVQALFSLLAAAAATAVLGLDLGSDSLAPWAAASLFLSLPLTFLYGWQTVRGNLDLAQEAIVYPDSIPAAQAALQEERNRIEAEFSRFGFATTAQQGSNGTFRLNVAAAADAVVSVAATEEIQRSLGSRHLAETDKRGTAGTWQSPHRVTFRPSISRSLLPFVVLKEIQRLGGRAAVVRAMAHRFRNGILLAKLVFVGLVLAGLLFTGLGLAVYHFAAFLSSTWSAVAPYLSSVSSQAVQAVSYLATDRLLIASIGILVFVLGTRIAPQKTSFTTRLLLFSLFMNSDVGSFFKYGFILPLFILSLRSNAPVTDAPESAAPSPASVRAQRGGELGMTAVEMLGPLLAMGAGAWGAGLLVSKILLLSGGLVLGAAAAGGLIAFSLALLGTRMVNRPYVQKFVARGGRPVVVVMVGGSNVRVGLNTDRGPAGYSSSPWTAKATPAETREEILRAISAAWEKIFTDFGITPDQVGRVAYSWAGPGLYEDGLVRATNIPGFREEDLSGGNVRFAGSYFDIAAWTRMRFLDQYGVRGLKVQVEHDGQSATGERHLLARQGLLAPAYLPGRPAYGGLAWEGTRFERKIETGIGEVGHHFELAGTASRPDLAYDPPSDGSPKYLRKAENLVAGVGAVFLFMDTWIAQNGKDMERFYEGLSAEARAKMGEGYDPESLRAATDLNHPENRQKEKIDFIHLVWAERLAAGDPVAVAAMDEMARRIGLQAARLLQAYPKGYFIANILGTGNGAGFWATEDRNLPTVITLLAGFIEKAGKTPGFMEKVHRAAAEALGTDVAAVSGRILLSPNDASRDMYSFLAENPSSSARRSGERGMTAVEMLGSILAMGAGAWGAWLAAAKVFLLGGGAVFGAAAAGGMAGFVLALVLLQGASDYRASARPGLARRAPLLALLLFLASCANAVGVPAKRPAAALVEEVTVETLSGMPAGWEKYSEDNTVVDRSRSELLQNRAAKLDGLIGQSAAGEGLWETLNIFMALSSREAWRTATFEVDGIPSNRGDGFQTWYFLAQLEVGNAGGIMAMLEPQIRSQSGDEGVAKVREGVAELTRMAGQVYGLLSALTPNNLGKIRKAVDGDPALAAYSADLLMLTGGMLVLERTSTGEEAVSPQTLRSGMQSAQAQGARFDEQAIKVLLERVTGARLKRVMDAAGEVYGAPQRAKLEAAWVAFRKAAEKVLGQSLEPYSKAKKIPSGSKPSSEPAPTVDPSVTPDGVRSASRAGERGMTIFELVVPLAAIGGGVYGFLAAKAGTIAFLAGTPAWGAGLLGAASVLVVLGLGYALFRGIAKRTPVLEVVSVVAAVTAISPVSAEAAPGDTVKVTQNFTGAVGSAADSTAGHALVDMEGDGIPDILAGTPRGAKGLNVLDSVTGRTKWAENANVPPNTGSFIARPVTYHTDEGSYQAIVVGARNGRNNVDVHLLNPADGTHYTQTPDGFLTSDPAKFPARDGSPFDIVLGGVDGKGRSIMAVLYDRVGNSERDSGYKIVVRSVDGHIIVADQVVESPLGGTLTSPVFMDVPARDKDGELTGQPAMVYASYTPGLRQVVVTARPPTKTGVFWKGTLSAPPGSTLRYVDTPQPLGDGRVAVYYAVDNNDTVGSDDDGRLAIFDLSLPAEDEASVVFHETVFDHVHEGPQFTQKGNTLSADLTGDGKPELVVLVESSQVERTGANPVRSRQIRARAFNQDGGDLWGGIREIHSDSAVDSTLRMSAYTPPIEVQVDGRGLVLMSVSHLTGFTYRLIALDSGGNKVLDAELPEHGAGYSVSLQAARNGEGPTATAALVGRENRGSGAFVQSVILGPLDTGGTSGTSGAPGSEAGSGGSAASTPGSGARTGAAGEFVPVEGRAGPLGSCSCQTSATHPVSGLAGLFFAALGSTFVAFRRAYRPERRGVLRNHVHQTGAANVEYALRLAEGAVPRSSGVLFRRAAAIAVLPLVLLTAVPLAFLSSAGESGNASVAPLGGMSAAGMSPYFDGIAALTGWTPLLIVAGLAAAGLAVYFRKLIAKGMDRLASLLGRKVLPVASMALVSAAVLVAVNGDIKAGSVSAVSLVDQLGADIVAPGSLDHLDAAAMEKGGTPVGAALIAAAADPLVMNNPDFRDALEKRVQELQADGKLPAVMDLAAATQLVETAAAREVPLSESLLPTDGTSPVLAAQVARSLTDLKAIAAQLSPFQAGQKGEVLLVVRAGLESTAEQVLAEAGLDGRSRVVLSEAVPQEGETDPASEAALLSPVEAWLGEMEGKGYKPGTAQVIVGLPGDMVRESDLPPDSVLLKKWGMSLVLFFDAVALRVEKMNEGFIKFIKYLAAMA